MAVHGAPVEEFDNRCSASAVVVDTDDSQDGELAVGRGEGEDVAGSQVGSCRHGRRTVFRVGCGPVSWSLNFASAALRLVNDVPPAARQSSNPRPESMTSRA
jgi:hypothetical protein